MSNRKAILKDVGTYASSAYAAQFLDFINGILVRRFLGPASMGLWAFLQVIVTYSKYSLLGTVQAANKEIPYLEGKKEHEKAEELKNNVYGFAVVSGVLNAVLCVVYGLWKNHKTSPDFVLGLFACALIIYGQRIYNYSVVILRVTKKFEVVSKLMIFSSVMTVVLTVMCTVPFGFYGFMVSQVVIFWINLGFINRYSPLQFKFSLHLEKLKPAFKLGFSLILCQIAYTFLTSLDRIMIAKMLGFKELGLFSVAIMANTYIVSFPNMAGIVLFPYYQEKFGERDEIKDLKTYVLYPTTTLTYLLPFLIAVVWFTSPLLLQYILPDYKGGLLALQVLILASFFLCMGQHFNIFLITINKQSRLFFATILAALLAVGCMYFSIKSGWGIVGVAFSELLAYSIYLAMLMILSLKYFAKKIILLWISIKVFLVITYAAGGFYLIQRLGGSLKIESFFLLTFGELFVSIAYLSPLLYFAQKETQVVSHVWEIVKEKWRRPESVVRQN